MAGRIINRRELRKQADEAGQAQEAAAAAPAKKTAKARTPAAPRKSRAKKVPTRMRARWGIFDGGMKQVAIFDYCQRADADAKLGDLLDKKKGTYFIQIVKEPMPEPAPADANVAAAV